MNSFMTLSSVSIGLPVVQAEGTRVTSSDDNTGNKTPPKIKVSSLPLYPEAKPRKVTEKPPTWLEGIVEDTRTQANSLKAEYQPVLDKIAHIVETGRAHTNEALIHLREEGNIGSQVGAIAFGGALGLISARRGGFFKKLTRFFFGVGAAGAVCYPEQAKIVAGATGNFALKNAKIAYHFVVGARPPVQNENGKPFERTVNLVSDVGKWGLKLFESKPSDESTTVQPPELSTNSNEKAQDMEAVETSFEVSPQPEPQMQEETKIDVAVVSGIDEVIPPAMVVPSNSESSDSNVSLESSSSDVSQVEPHDTKATTEEPIAVLGVPELPSAIDEGKLEPVKIDGNSSNDEENRAASTEPADTNPKPVFELDLGQGSLEDKELYTTRD